jgi:CRP-like cAMP-binding protein
LVLQANFGLDAQNTIQVVLSREEIANIVGTATETVIRMLAKFANDGLIELDGKKIRLVSIPELTQMAKLTE